MKVHTCSGLFLSMRSFIKFLYLCAIVSWDPFLVFSPASSIPSPSHVGKRGPASKTENNLKVNVQRQKFKRDWGRGSSREIIKYKPNWLKEMHTHSNSKPATGTGNTIYPLMETFPLNHCGGKINLIIGCKFHSLSAQIRVDELIFLQVISCSWESGLRWCVCQVIWVRVSWWPGARWLVELDIMDSKS